MFSTPVTFLHTKQDTDYVFQVCLTLSDVGFRILVLRWERGEEGGVLSRAVFPRGSVGIPQQEFFKSHRKY